MLPEVGRRRGERQASGRRAGAPRAAAGAICAWPRNAVWVLAIGMATSFERIGPEGDTVLRNLYEHYVHDMSEWLPIDVGPDGLYRYDTGSIWKGGGEVVLCRVDGALAGFGVVSSAEPWLGHSEARDTKDFFVLRRYRRQGVGVAMAHHLWRSSPGEWLVRVLVANRPALPFWRRAVRGFTGGKFDEQAVIDKGRGWVHLRFDSPAA